jgi:hypothetical protein
MRVPQMAMRNIFAQLIAASIRLKMAELAPIPSAIPPRH